MLLFKGYKWKWLYVAKENFVRGAAEISTQTDANCLKRSQTKISLYMFYDDRVNKVKKVRCRTRFTGYRCPALSHLVSQPPQCTSAARSGRSRGRPLYAELPLGRPSKHALSQSIASQASRVHFISLLSTLYSRQKKIRSDNTCVVNSQWI